MEDDECATGRMGGIKLEDDTANGTHRDPGDVVAAPKSELREGETWSPALSHDSKPHSDAGDGTPASQKQRLSRKSSQKNDQAHHEPALYSHLPDATEESCKTFRVIPDCLYGSKHLGSTDNDAFDCDCREEWQNGENIACGEDSDCINRATKMECSSTSGNCGGGCQNQRFQRREYASVSVIKTEKKGFGLRCDLELHANDFIFEYIGEVINEPTFRRRMLQYDEEGVKHFYFMSLSKSEFVDATKKGNLGRFCNHSCNPNCYVDKWVVGDKLRMGIFALRTIRPGEELVFNYNVDRYGAKPQPCYCGEPNCIGFIGGKTQTERVTKLPQATVEALGIDGGDGWDTTVAKKPRKKRADESDEEYVTSIQPRSLDEDDARKVMATLMQCKEKWIAVKLLERIQRCHEERVIHCVMRMHAYQILKTVLNTFYEDDNVVLQVLSILDKFPRLTRNKIQDSKIEAAIEPLTRSEHEDVSSTAQRLLGDWSKLEVAYRIRRRQVDSVAPSVNAFDDRRGAAAREEEQSSAKTASPSTVDAPKGPRGNQPQRNSSYGHFSQRPRQRPAPPASLPSGWFAAKDAAGRTYFYDKQGSTTWTRPSKPSTEPSVNRAAQEQLMIQNIIKKVTQEGSTPKQSSVHTPQSEEPPSTKDSKQDRWRSLPIEKQMKIYENTIFPAIKHVLDKFRRELPKEELKRLGKDISKKLVASDYKNNRVEDPSAALSEKQSQKIKKYVKEFLAKAVVKYNSQQKGHKPTLGSSSNTPMGGDGEADSSGTKVELVMGSSATPVASPAVPNNDEPAAAASGTENGQMPPDMDRKRKREDEEAAEAAAAAVSGARDPKRAREESDLAGGSPPPPPPPPAEPDQEGLTPEETRALREQEEALVRENEEAQRLEDEASKTAHMDLAPGEAQGDDSAAVDEARGTQSQEVMSH